MNKKFRSLVACFLAILTLCLTFAPYAVAAESKYENDLPIVYVKGAGREIYTADGKQIMPFVVEPEDRIMEESDRLLAAFASSVLSKNWDTFCDELVDVVSEVYADAVLDKNGEASDGSYIKPNAKPKKKTANFYLSDYIFNYDSRLDPWDVAEDLDAYIDQVLKATGKSKVQIVSRCLGSNYAAAYLTRYGAKKVETCIFYVPSTKGTVVCSESFSGKFRFDADLINDYVNNYMGESDENMMGLIQSVVSVTHALSILHSGTDLVQSVYDQISSNVVPRLLLASYATMPAYWSMVDDDNYEEAKRLIFGSNSAEYAGLIEKIDNYHYNVMNNLDVTLKNLKKQGMKVAVIAKYNVALPPIFQSSEKQADGTIELYNLSFGATSADMGKTLTRDYLEQVSLSGSSKYVSPDLIVDASTCLFPNYTWFVKDSPHEDFATSINQLIYEVIKTKKQVTVTSTEEYPQFLQYKTNNTLVEVKKAEANGNTGNEGSFIEILTGLFGKIIAFFRSLFSIFIQ